MKSLRRLIAELLLVMARWVDPERGRVVLVMDPGEALICRASASLDARRKNGEAQEPLRG